MKAEAKAKDVEVEIDDGFISEVEDEVGMSSFAWDCVNAKEIVKAVIKIHTKKLLKKLFPLD